MPCCFGLNENFNNYLYIYNINMNEIVTFQ